MIILFFSKFFFKNTIELGKIEKEKIVSILIIVILYKLL